MSFKAQTSNSSVGEASLVVYPVPQGFLVDNSATATDTPTAEDFKASEVDYKDDSVQEGSADQAGFSFLIAVEKVKPMIASPVEYTMA